MGGHRLHGRLLPVLHVPGRALAGQHTLRPAPRHQAHAVAVAVAVTGNDADAGTRGGTSAPARGSTQRRRASQHEHEREHEHERIRGRGAAGGPCAEEGLGRRVWTLDAQFGCALAVRAAFPPGLFRVRGRELQRDGGRHGPGRQAPRQGQAQAQAHAPETAAPERLGLRQTGATRRAHGKLRSGKGQHRLAHIAARQGSSAKAMRRVCQTPHAHAFPRVCVFARFLLFIRLSVCRRL